MQAYSSEPYDVKHRCEGDSKSSKQPLIGGQISNKQMDRADKGG
ncbi:hypothetical protein EDC90_10314 [Martelella mediterranea]|uniref:Uncharacterized protein n=1 Tax=Martelella mediterranea TaxID=293089 RepID=A0A4R3NK57_9HYPH|nr:hypothetical protein EDC90_10314 [Martelella mediterranea]